MPSCWELNPQINMTNSTSLDQAQYVQAMFGRIADRYDLMNRLMTAGQDIRWRREVITRTNLPAGGRILDLGAGTGDLAREALFQIPDCRPVAADFSLKMMRVGRDRHKSPGLNWSAADALSLPFPNELFDAVVSGFLLRNVTDVDRSLREQHRVLKSGGHMVALDTTQPGRNFLWPLINFYLHVIIPTLGRLITGAPDAYTYLPDSTEAFLEAEQLAARMEAAGYKQVGFRRLMVGTVAIHWGEK
jgi:demethylmenaquinone methyltransferase/2-methoxy-6-polyprenyl-1,4-benzoquinol methylase